MKIVINVCFGGFGLSREALKELSNMGVDTYSSWDDLKSKKDNSQWILLSDKDAYSNYSDYRTDANLISVVEALGKKANGMCANLSIVDIPDGISWEIDDYDGNESISESHRSWS